MHQYSFFLHAYDPKTFKAYQLNANGIDCTGLSPERVREVADIILSRLEFLDSSDEEKSGAGGMSVLSIDAEGGPLVPASFYSED